MRWFAFVLAALAVLTVLPRPVAAQMALDLRPSIDATSDNVSPAPAEEDESPLVLRRAPASVDPYAPLGIRAGAFILYPSLTVGGGYTTNSSSSAGGTGAAFATVTPELRIESDWQRHAATLTMRGSYEKFFDGTADNPAGSIQGTGRIDLPDDWTVDLAAGYDYSRQQISDSDYPAGADTPPGVHDLTSAAALNGILGRTTFTVEGTAERTLYEDATSGGTTIDQGDRDNTLLGGRLRVGYDGGGLFKPFVEGRVTRRLYDQATDDDGVMRSGTGLAGRVGFAVDDEPVLKGELAVGVATMKLDDPAFAAFQALTVDGSLVWSPMELTTITFDASTALNPSTDPASPGAVVHEGGIETAYALRENVTLAASGDISREAVQGTGEVNTTYTAGVSAVWKLNRAAQLKASYEHAWLNSTTHASDYQSDTVRLELKTQR